VQQSTIAGLDWTLYTSARAETITQLGLTSDTPLQPAYAWQTASDTIWESSGTAFLSHSPRFPISQEIHLLFAPDDWTTIPAAQVFVSGPPDSGFASSLGSYLISDPDDTIWYAVPSQSKNYPEPGDYVVSYRGKSYPGFQASVPAAATTALPLPSVGLDAARQLAVVSWQYRHPQTGQAAEEMALQSMTGQSVSVYTMNGPLALEQGIIPADARQLALPVEAQVPWDEVTSIVMISWHENATRVVSHFRVSHLDQPLQVYFNEGIVHGEWMLVPWLGWLSERAWPWVWSQRHGFVFLTGSGNGQVFAWTTDLGWIHFNATIYPMYYHYHSASWSQF
jgi:hypothetical protein